MVWGFLQFVFWPHHVACWILVPQEGLEPRPPQWKCWVLTSGLSTVREFPMFLILIKKVWKPFYGINSKIYC